MKSQFNVCLSDSYEVFAVIFDDSVYLHGFLETNEAPELSFDLFRILFRAIIISTMRNYLSKNSHTHPMKIDQTKNHARHFMWCRCMLWCSVVFSFYLMSVFFFRGFFTLDIGLEKAPSWFERQNSSLRLGSFPRGHLNFMEMKLSLKFFFL